MFKNIIYAHGLGGSGNGSSRKNVEALVRKLFGNDINFFAETNDLLKPAEAFNNITKYTSADLIIASSLGGFLASCLPLTKDSNTKIILLNPCLVPQEAIEPILWEEQKPLFNKEKCIKEWNEIQSVWDKNNIERNNHYVGIFSDNDEFFHYKPVFDDNFKASFINSAIINGTHEIAKDTNQLETAISTALKLLSV